MGEIIFEVTKFKTVLYLPQFYVFLRLTHFPHFSHTLYWPSWVLILLLVAGKEDVSRFQQTQSFEHLRYKPLQATVHLWVSEISVVGFQLGFWCLFNSLGLFLVVRFLCTYKPSDVGVSSFHIVLFFKCFFPFSITRVLS